MNRLRIALFTTIGLITILAGVAVLFKLYNNPRLLSPIDFLEYWGAGKLILAGEDPYDPHALHDVQYAANPVDIKNSIIMWNPPWTLPAVMPFGLLPWRDAQLLWMACQLVCLFIAADLFWRYYGGPPGYRWVAWLLALFFGPTLVLLRMGQITGLLLLGLAGFLCGVRHKNYLLMGVSVAVLAIKPHLFILFGLCFGLEALAGRSTRILVSKAACVTVLTVLVGSAIPLIWDPHIWSEYFALAHRPPSDDFDHPSTFILPTLGYAIRQMVPGQPFEAQFYPLLIAASALPLYWLLRRKDWNWDQELPRLTLVAALTACYGAWYFDLVILVLPVIQSAAWLKDATVQNKRLFLGIFLAPALFAVLKLGGRGIPYLEMWMILWIGSAYVAASILCNTAIRETVEKPVAIPITG